MIQVNLFILIADKNEINEAKYRYKNSFILPTG